MPPPDSTLVAAVAHEPLAPGRAFTGVGRERDLDGRHQRRARRAAGAPASAAIIPKTKRLHGVEGSRRFLLRVILCHIPARRDLFPRIAVAAGVVLPLAPLSAATRARAEAARGRARDGGRAPSPKLDVKNWKLPNGLKVLFLAEHKAPIATVQVFYHVGSKDERAASAASRTCSST